MMESYSKMLQEVKSHIDFDYMPLDSIVDEFSDNFRPSKKEFREALNFVSKMLDEEEIICIEGPEMKKVDGSGIEISERLWELYNSKGFEDIHYRFWFDWKYS